MALNRTHSYNHGLVTSSKGSAIEFVKVTGLNVAPGAAATCTVYDGASNLIYTVIHSATGIYDFQMNQPYPPSLYIVHPAISNADGTTNLIHPAYKSGSYNATTGVFTINLMNDDDSGAPVLVAGGATDELHVILIFARYNTLD